MRLSQFASNQSPLIPNQMRAPSSSSSIPSLTFFFFLAFFLVRGSVGDCSEYHHSPMAMTGAITDSQGFQNSLETQDLARFAVDEHNKKQNALLEFARVVKAQEQVVAGTLHHITLEAIDAGEKKIYHAKVWVKPWMNFKELTEFEHVADAPPFTSADLGVKKDVHKSGWQSVPTQDPQVQDAADHALKTIQQRSNSLVPYELHEVVDAKAEVGDDFAKFNLLLKVKRGDKEEKFKVEVHKNNEEWLPVPTDHPLVQVAADHSLNSFLDKPYEVLDAKAEVEVDFTTSDLLLKVKQLDKRDKEEEFGVGVYMNNRGPLYRVPFA